jgi:hypothetical protein
LPATGEHCSPRSIGGGIEDDETLIFHDLQQLAGEKRISIYLRIDQP